MTPERWEKTDRIFHTALKLLPEKRASYLNDSCAGDDELRKEVDRILASHEDGVSFMDKPAMDVAARNPPESRASGELWGYSISHYRILEKMGDGEQPDGGVK